MDPISFLLLFLIVVVGGVVAFFADRLGRKLGKKRLSLLGLRPRHTAEVLTVAAGMVIPLFTIIVLLGLSSGIREWVAIGVAGVEKLKREQKDLLDRNADLRKTNADLASTIPKLNAEAVKLKRLTAQLKTDVDKAVNQRDLVRAEADRLKLQSARLSGQVNRLNGTVRLLNVNLRTKRDQFNKVQRDYAAILPKLDAANLSLQKLKRDYDTLEGQMKEQYEEDARLRAKGEELQLQVDTLNQTKTDLGAQLEKAKQDLDRYQHDLERVKVDVEEKQQEVDRLVAQQDQLKSAFDTSLLNTRFARLVTSAGSELSRVSLDPQETPIAARAALQNLLTQSSKTADILGAKPSKPGELSAMLRDLPLANGKKISADEQVAAIIKAVANLPEESVLVAYSYWNVYEGESVPLQIRPFRNPVVYRAGELIAESRIDGHLPDDQIIGQIKDGLLMSVRQRAKRDRMIPAGSDESFGAVTIEQLSALVRDLKTENRRVRLQAVAKSDTRAADQLQLSFRIKY